MPLLEGLQMPGTTTTLLVSAGACIVGGVVGGLLVKKVSSKSVEQAPQKWIKVGVVKELVIYPVKSIPGISVTETQLGSMGFVGLGSPLLRDRVFVIANEKGEVFTQKKIPILALTRVQVEGNQLIISYVKDPSKQITVQVPLDTDLEHPIKTVTLFGENIRAIDCGDKVSAWLSNLAETPNLRLLYHVGAITQRGPAPRNLRFPTYTGKDAVSRYIMEEAGAFHDETSYMLMTDESVAEVNRHLKNPVSHRNFRPTIILNGVVEPFAEDLWGYIKFGEGEDAPILKTSRPCIRCKLTVVDPDTGTFREDGEPLTTLYKLKRPVGDEKLTKMVSKSAVLGAHFGLWRGEGSVIRVGDPVYAALL